MAVLNNIREKSPKFIIAGAAVIFIVLIVFDWGLDLSGRRGRGGSKMEALGKVNGQEISYKQYNDFVRQAIENQKKQTGVEVDDEMERNIRSQAWNQIIDDMLIDQEVERLGITVSDQEILDIVTGPNPPDFLVRQFTDSTGTFRRDAYYDAMRDVQNRQAWVQVEELLRHEQKRQKLRRILLATVTVSEDEVKEQFISRNTTLDADYALFDINRMIPDSAVTVTDDDIQSEYDSHPENFQAKASRRIKLVYFNQNPSAEDTASVLEQLTQFYDEVKSKKSDFIDLAKIYSDVPVSDVYYKHGELSRQKEDAVFSAKKGEIIGPVKDSDGLHLIKVLDFRQGPTEFVKASHILLREVKGPDSIKVIQNARSILARAKAGEDFAKLARENSQDNSSIQGGDLGWNSRQRWVKPFADAAFKARPGEIVGPVRTQFGWHIIKVTGKDRREVKFVDLAMKIKPSSETINNAFQNAQDFAYLAKEEGFEKAAENSNLPVQESPEFTKSGMIPGIGQNDAMLNFAFTGKLGAISEPITVRNSVAVAIISKIREEGTRPLDEVKNIVRSMALKEKKMEKIRARAEEFYKGLGASGNLIAAARAIPNVIAQNTGPFKPSESVMGIGRDLRFIGSVLAMKPGETSGPVEGNNGFYIIKLLSRSGFDSVKYNSEKEALASQILQEKRQRVFAEWQMELHDKADIIDNREHYR